MTMTEMRKTVTEKSRSYRAMGLGELADYIESAKKTFEELWKEGYTRNFDNDFLKFANGYQFNTGDYTDLHIAQTFDLHSISATKRAVKDMMEKFFND